MSMARDIAWLALCSLLAAGFVFSTLWIWLAIGAAIMTVGR